MKFHEYLRDNLSKILVATAFGILFTAILLIFRVDIFILTSFLVLFSLLCAFLLFYDFFKKRTFYNDLLGILFKLDQKYLLPEMIEQPNFLEGKIFFDALHDTSKSMNEQTKIYKDQTTDFRDFIELWVHEVKTPLSGLALMMRPSDKNAQVFIKEIDDHIERALYYSKIDISNQDYVIKKVSLEKIVNVTIRNNKYALISQGVKLKLDGLNKYVYSDSKWLGFIINQIILNSIKYCSKNPEIDISATKEGDYTVLTIQDNGIGIKPGELKHIFDKGFTGSNDRKTKASTGMGLYIANKLSHDLGHKILAKSKLGEYTKTMIYFGKNDVLIPE